MQMFIKKLKNRAAALVRTSVCKAIQEQEVHMVPKTWDVGLFTSQNNANYLNQKGTITRRAKRAKISGN